MEEPMEQAPQGAPQQAAPPQPGAGQAMPPPGGPQPGGPPGAPPEGGQDPDVAEVERGMKAIAEMLYKNEASSDAFLKSVKPNDKAGSTSKAAILLITEIDKKINLSERVLGVLSGIAAGEVMELAEAGHGITYSEKEQQQIVMTTFEGILQAYGVDPQHAANVAGQADEAQQKEAMSMYEGALNV